MIKINESTIRKIIRDELKNSLVLEQVFDGPPRMDPTVHAELERQRIEDPSLPGASVVIGSDGESSLGELEMPSAEDVLAFLGHNFGPDIPCADTSIANPSMPSLSTKRSGPAIFDYTVDSNTGYVFSSNALCRGSDKIYISNSLDDAFHTFFNLYGAQSGNYEYWLANQLLKHSVGRSQVREAAPDPSEGVEDVPTTIDDLEAIFEEWSSRYILSEDNSEELDPYEENIYQAIRSANLSNNQNRINPNRMKDLARRLSSYQEEIRDDPKRAMFNMYVCKKISGMYGSPIPVRDWLGKYDPLMDIGQDCRFVGYSSDPSLGTATGDGIGSPVRSMGRDMYFY